MDRATQVELAVLRGMIQALQLQLVMLKFEGISLEEAQEKASQVLGDLEREARLALTDQSPSDPTRGPSPD